MITRLISFNAILLCALSVNAQEEVEDLLPNWPAAKPVAKVAQKVVLPAPAPAPAPRPKKVFTHEKDIRLLNEDFKLKGNDPNVRYLTIGASPRNLLDRWSWAIKYQVPAASRAQLIDRQVPQNVKGSRVFSINLESLKWSIDDFNKVLEKYPYDYNDPKNPLLVIRGDWLLREIADTRDSRAYYLLLYGEKDIPKTDAEFLTYWGYDVNQQIGQSFGWVEVKSQVSLQETRLIEHYNLRGQSGWRTKDMFKVTRKTDPLEVLNGSFKHDGRELIAQVSKVSLRRKIRGASQVYMLANGEGKSVNEAPVRLVEDLRRTLGQTAIVNNASCVSCHDKGMNFPSSNGLADALEAGDEVYAYTQGKQEEIEEFFLTDSGGRLYRNNDDFARFIAACNNLKPEANAKNYREMLDDYNANLNLDRAAGELYVTPETLRLALGYASQQKILIGSRLIALTRGGTVRRSAWEETFLETREVVKKWQAIKLSNLQKNFTQ